MTRPSVISVDAMGGDKGPAPILAGMSRALRHHPDLRFIVHGDETSIARLLRKRSNAGLRERVEMRHSDHTVDMSEKPSHALRHGKGSSMWNALASVKEGAARVAISSGNTGALMAMAMTVLRKAPGIDRPAIAVHWPSIQPHGFNTVLDMGAHVRADARNLVEYAVMGAEYARISFNTERPRVGLLNVGTEAMKGTDSLREAMALLETAAAAPEARFSFVGFVEGTDMTHDHADVIVTDGFTGNVALKTAEGTAQFIRGGLKDAFRHSPLSRLAALFAMTSLKRFSRRIDPRRVNGGVFLGLNGAVIKSHGGADAVGFEAAINLAAKMTATDFEAGVNAELARLGDVIDLGAAVGAHHDRAPVERTAGAGAPQEKDEG